MPAAYRLLSILLTSGIARRADELDLSSAEERRTGHTAAGDLIDVLQYADTCDSAFALFSYVASANLL